MSLVVLFILTLVISIPILIVSMILTSKTMGGVEFGSLGSVIAKGAILLIAADLVWLLPIGFFGWILALAVWWFGLMLLFKIDFWEARTLVVINWLLNLLLRFALLTLFAV